MFKIIGHQYYVGYSTSNGQYLRGDYYHLFSMLRDSSVDLVIYNQSILNISDDFNKLFNTINIKLKTNGYFLLNIDSNRIDSILNINSLNLIKSFQYSNLKYNRCIYLFNKHSNINNINLNLNLNLTANINILIESLTKEGDTIVDLSAGTNIVGWIAERMNRYWISFDKHRYNAATSMLRFINNKEYYLDILNKKYICV